MHFTIQRETLLNPLQRVIGVIERRQTKAVLGNFLMRVADNVLTIGGTDMEVEMIARVDVTQAEDGEITVPARKLFDIVRALADGTSISFQLQQQKMQINAGKSRFSLATLPADDFPLIESINEVTSVTLADQTLKQLLERTAFAMASQDVRFYLNGLLLELDQKALRCVATDGHRLAIAEAPLDTPVEKNLQVIIPRKGVTELQNLFDGEQGDISLNIAHNHIRISHNNVVFTSQLIDGKYPDYQAVIPLGLDMQLEMNRQQLRMALQRAAILSNEKLRGVKLDISPGLMTVTSHNPEQEEATEEVPAVTSIENLSIGFNVTYLLDALNALPVEDIEIKLRDGQSSCVIQAKGKEDVRYIVMPLRL